MKRPNQIQNASRRRGVAARFPVGLWAGPLAAMLVAVFTADRAVAQQTPAPAASQTQAAVDEAAVVAQAIAELREKAMRRDQVDWKDIDREAKARLARGEDLQTVLEAIVARLEDGHSRVLTPAQVRQMTAGQAEAGAARTDARPQMPAPIPPSGRLLTSPGGCAIGYLRVPFLISIEAESIAGYVNTLVALQKELAARGAKGWVVDLRGNIGGNQWPMLAALSGILGDGEHGAVVTPDGGRMAWGTRPGAAWAMSPENTAVGDAAFIAPDTSTWPAAVLLDRYTASSGEAIAISFRGRPRTRSFGDPTSGRSSANTLIPLAHGGMIALTTSLMMDRAGKSYGGRLAPDEVLGLPTPEWGAALPIERGEVDAAVDASLRWLDAGCGKRR